MSVDDSSGKPPSDFLYLLLDERWHTDPGDAAVLCSASSLKEARRDRATMFPNSVIVRHKILGTKDKDGAWLVGDEEFVE